MGGSTSNWGTIHNFKFGDSFTLVVLVRWRPRRLASDNREFHVLDLYPHKKEVDLSHNHVLQMVSSPSLAKVEHETRQ